MGGGVLGCEGGGAKGGGRLGWGAEAGRHRALPDPPAAGRQNRTAPGRGDRVGGGLARAGAIHFALVAFSMCPGGLTSIPEQRLGGGVSGVGKRNPGTPDSPAKEIGKRVTRGERMEGGWLSSP